MKKILVVIVILAGVFVSKTMLDGKKSFAETFKDPRDGQTYGIVKIGSQVWMAENLNYEVKLSHCQEEKSKNCQKYGRFYVWDEAVKACPPGWHLPSKWEWETLFTTAGGQLTAGKELKSTSGWRSNGNGTDTYGFSALPADGHQYGYYAMFWSSTETSSTIAYHVALVNKHEGVGSGENDKNFGMAVRCVKD